MKTILEDIRSKISNGFYQNEEHIRLNLILRILVKLEWDIWNPKEVFAEFYVAPDEDKTKVDLALIQNHFSPSVFIEVKYLGKIFEKLTAVERQLRNYNRDNTATFSIISDGNIWRFYYSKSGGEFAKKCFKQINLLNDDIEDIEIVFFTFLNKNEIISGNAENEASKYLKLSQKQKAMEDALPQAKRLIQEPPYPSLPQCLVSILKNIGIEITIEEAIKYIKSPPPKESGDLYKQGNNQKPESPIIEDLRFTKILEGKIGQSYSRSWNELLRLALKYAITSGLSLDDLYRLTNLNIKPGLHNQHGFHPIPDNNLSIQDVEATKAAINIKKIAKKLNLSLFIEFEWRGKSSNAGKKSVIKIGAL